MKSFAILALGAGAAVAQSLTDLPQCGQTCINNMVNIASSSFGCPAGDVVCYCTNKDFGFGVRDCANQACQNGESGQVILFGAQYCEGALASASTSGAALGPLTSALATATNTGGASNTDSAGSTITDAPKSTAISTQALVGTVTGTDGSAHETTTGFSTIYSSLAADASSARSSIDSALSSITGSAASAASSAASSLASKASSLESSIASAVSSALSSGASEAASIASSLASEATGASSTGGAAPMMTGMPLAGAAGLAAWLLL